MLKYEDLEKKYGDKIKKSMDFSEFLQKLLEEHFNEETVIDRLFDMHNEENRLISERDVKIMEREEEFYNQLLALCGRENKDALEEILCLNEENKQDLVEFYSKEFYKLGIKDGKSLKKNF